MYNHKEIEKKWQDYWVKNKTYKTFNPWDEGFDDSKQKYYVLDMFPYPSWAWLHVGHPEWYTANDIIARYKKATGHNVLHPMWWDAFGLPAENYAIKTGRHPRLTTDENIATFKRQIQSLGISYDWDREIDTTDPKYFQWTQWIFLKLFEAGLAYEQDLPINYCPSCKTGLANEEVLNDNSCERCGNQVEKKKIRQWVLAITKYADRLHDDVDELDWPQGIKDMQKNWIGRSEGCEFEMMKWEEFNDDSESSSEWRNSTKSIRVYTTRIDTVFGMTYAVIAPDHPHVTDFIEDSHKLECDVYIEKTKSESDQERTADNKEKTGVFTGSYVVNPYNQEKIPVWIADYVLGHYGTWAIMAVPAHDERDFAFAKKYGLEIRQVVAESFVYTWKNAPKKWVETLHRKTIDLIVEDTEWNFLLQVKKHDNGEHIHFVWGWIDGWDTEMNTVSKELIEETGYTDFEIIWPVEWTYVYSLWYRANKDKNQQCIGRAFHIRLKSKKQVRSEIDDGKHAIVWVKKEEVERHINWTGHKKFWSTFLNWNSASAIYWVAINSWKYDLNDSYQLKETLTQVAEDQWFWYKKVNYKLRDWLFSRQRYWGEPIPLIHLDHKDFLSLKTINDLNMAREDDKAYILDFAHFLSEEDEGKEQFLVINKEIFWRIYDWLYGKIVCDYNLPLRLPEIESYEPAGDGQSPLARVDTFVNVQLAENLHWKRETNTMPQWWGSCWYYLRFIDPNNSKELVSKQNADYWGSVDSYVGWAEHAVLHLLYARFWHKFLYDQWLVSTSEPFQKLRNQWMVLAYGYQTKQWKAIANDLVEEKKEKFYLIETWEEVQQVVTKMSKSYKNVVNPDDIVQEYGADALRLYEMYIADFKDSAPWDTRNIVWVKRFLDKAWRACLDKDVKKAIDDWEAMKLLHKTIKKVSKDIENYKFNTAIAQMMILVNYGRPNDEMLFAEWSEKFIIMLSAFAPHIWEELYSKLWKEESVFFADWPVFAENMIIDDIITIWVQVLWKLRGEIQIAKDETKEAVLEKAKSLDSIQKWLEWKELVKEIYVPWRIVNLVVK